MKDRFVLYTTYADAILGMTDEQAGVLLKAIFRFVTTGEQEEIEDGIVRFAYRLIVSQIELSDKQYKQKCEKLRANIQKRWNTEVNNSNATDTTKPDCIQKNTNVYNGKQKNTTEYDCIHINKELNKERKKEKEEEDEKKNVEHSLFSNENSSTSVYDEILEFWNSEVSRTQSAMKRITQMTERRKSAVRARMREHRPDGLEAVKTMIRNAVTSDFLNGRNSRSKVFAFDGLMAPDMFQKTLEGNFNDKPQAAAEQHRAAHGAAAGGAEDKAAGTAGEVRRYD